MTNNFTSDLILYGVIILSYFILYLLSTFIISKELKKKNTKRISKAKTYGTNSRQGDKFDYEFYLNQNVDGLRIRLVAKLIDYGIYIVLFYLIDRLLIEINLYPPFLLAFFALFIVNPILESLTGRTFGKYVFGIRVIDDFGENPSFLTSFIKNLLQPFSVVFYLLSSAKKLEEKIVIRHKEEIFFHNKLTFTYTIWNKNKEKIFTELNN